ncbi:uncharacterized protein BYT42DRAFT_188138 [Radiomyces spectabilis]|uniref:uncharacterized protein n=1 Tax=Radiomyces spectabilis TaxID=64574 RepID=UPI00221FFBA9|nr:uncharacterized protein BYT42DRAFT_188138 [Radiomyces spectabilis]KAI8391271.1 hypothetical protein BYT42DRAFT_188138 [Radiomyces spectabilis]
MSSIFKAVRDNDVETINNYILLALGEPIRNLGFAKEDQRRLQRYFKSAGCKRFDINKRSILGRTALHCAASWNRIEITKALMACPLVDVNIQDRENGWTALHRALYEGNLEIAMFLIKHDDIDLNIKDSEGLGAFELLTTEPMHDTLTENLVNDSDDDDDSVHTPDIDVMGAKDIYSWGVNTNYVLGQRDSENRTFPERVPLEPERQFLSSYDTSRPYSYKSVYMSKFHMAIITNDRLHNFFVCGYGRGGRLGTGKEIDTQLVPIPILPKEHIVTAALGRDHTIAVSGSNDIFTFGSNQFGQLGYEIGGDHMQLVPRKVQIPGWKRMSFTGAAASSVHSVVYSGTEVYTFGLNQGQLGYHADDEKLQVTPRKVAFSFPSIRQVEATDYATVVLTDHDVYVLSDYQMKKMIFPIARFPPDIVVHGTQRHTITKLLVGTGDYMGAISNQGDVYVWTCKPNTSRQATVTASSKKTDVSVVVGEPVRVWTCGKKRMGAHDASIGQHGDVIVCTESGLVYVGTKIKDTAGPRYKYTGVPYLQRCIQVCANVSGAFVALRADDRLTNLFSQPMTLIQDMRHALPFKKVNKHLQDIVADIEREKQRALAKEKQTLLDPENDNATDVVKDIIDHAQALRKEAIENAWKEIERRSIADKSTNVVFTVKDRRFYGHAAIIASRCARFEDLVERQDEIEHIQIEKKDHWIHINVSGIRSSSFYFFLEFLYTNDLISPQSQGFTTPPLCQLENNFDTKTLEKEMSFLASLFGVTLEYRPLYHEPNLEPALSEAFRLLLQNPKYRDVKIQLQDGFLLADQVILRQRCPFFTALLSSEAPWSEVRRQQLLTTTSNGPAYLEVDLKHLRMDIMKVVLRFIYTEVAEDEIYLYLHDMPSERMLDYLLDMLRVADELLLPRLVSICETFLLHFLNLRTAITLVEATDLYSADRLKAVCQRYILSNLPYFLLSGTMDHLRTTTIHTLEEQFRSLQAQVHATIQINESMGDSIAEREDDEFSSSLFALLRGDAPLPNRQFETLVTIRPEHDKEPGSPTAQSAPSRRPSVPSEANVRKQPAKKKKVRLLTEFLEGEKANKTVPDEKLVPGWAIPSDAKTTGTTTSLRDILGEKGKSTDPTASNVKVSSAVPALKKLSQKERRKLHQRELATNMSTMTESSKSVWGKVTVENPISLADSSSKQPAPILSPCLPEAIQVDEVKGKGKKIYVSKDVLDETMSVRPHNIALDIPAPAQNIVDRLGSSFTMVPIRRAGSSKGPLSNQNLEPASLRSIIQQQKIEDDWIKGRRPRKSLVQIQTEERAKQGLYEFYVQTIELKSGEWFEISHSDQ